MKAVVVRERITWFDSYTFVGIYTNKSKLKQLIRKLFDTCEDYEVSVSDDYSLDSLLKDLDIKEMDKHINGLSFEEIDFNTELQLNEEISWS